MSPRQPYDRQMRRRRPDGYDRGLAGPRRYDRGYRGGYDRNAGLDLGRYGTPFPGAAGYPAARWGWGPIGWAAWDPMLGIGTEPMPGMYGYGAPAPPLRRRPEESRSYGRGGDRELQRWARSRGYDTGYEIRPRRSPGR